ncbi:MAG TPA: hypothetical protein VGF18_08885, partial [Candidatus Tumulicola sp.]
MIRGVVVFFALASIGTAGCSGIGDLPSPGILAGQRLNADAVTGSWISPDAKGGGLVYVTSATQVNVYTWPKLRRAGVLEGFQFANAACADSAGDVWIADFETRRLYEYLHGGTAPVATLDDTPNFPMSCAVDKRSGDLAVGNTYSDGLGKGSVTLFEHAGGSGTAYYSSSFFDVFGIGYEPSGAVYLAGWTGSAFTMASFSHKQFTTIGIQGATLKYPGGVQYADGALTVADAGNTITNTVIYRITNQGVVLGKTVLGDGYQAPGYEIVKNKLVWACYEERQVQLYDYPAG